nr:uncharacterized protein LOC111421903 [Onthophagus taurus]
MMKVCIFVAYILVQLLIGNSNAAEPMIKALEDDTITVDNNTRKFEIGSNNMDTAMKDAVMNTINNAYDSTNGSKGRTNYIQNRMDEIYSDYKWIIIEDPESQSYGSIVKRYLWIKKRYNLVWSTFVLLGCQV